MKLFNLLVVVVISFVVALVTAYYFSSSPKLGSGTKKETVYERIVRTGAIRCGYTSWDPIFFVDSKTGEKRGIFHDVMEEVGQRLNLKILWQEEIGWGTIVQSIKDGRVDMACSGYWLNPGRIKNLSSSVAQLYTPLYVVGRQDDSRSFKNLSDVNSDKLTVASIDGSAENQAVSKRFPKTKVLALPELDTNADEIQSLLTNKVDFIILDSATIDNYTAQNPGKVKILFLNQPIVLFPNVMLLPPEEAQLKEMIDDTLLNIEYDGTLDSILNAYKAHDSFLQNPQPYQLKP